ncbi:MAG: SGNH/GDSL hydrolase family protein [Nitriliruptoraceae bacterium]
MQDRIRSYLALGDSFTEGLEDERGADGRHRGWSDRVAEALAKREPALRYGNLAVRGRLLEEVIEEQVPLARQLRPDLVSFHAGGNDVLRPGVEVATVGARYEEAVASLRSEGLAVLLFTVLERAGGTGRLADALAARFATFNVHVRTTAARHGALLVDVGAVRALQDRRLWHADRLHLAPPGHARVAAAVLETLGVTDPDLLGGEPGWWRLPLLATARPPLPARAVGQAAWATRYLVPWLGRRLRGTSSGDGVSCKRPELAPLRGR